MPVAVICGHPLFWIQHQLLGKRLDVKGPRDTRQPLWPLGAAPGWLWLPVSAQSQELCLHQRRVPSPISIQHACLWEEHSPVWGLILMDLSWSFEPCRVMGPLPSYGCSLPRLPRHCVCRRLAPDVTISPHRPEEEPDTGAVTWNRGATERQHLGLHICPDSCSLVTSAHGLRILGSRGGLSTVPGQTCRARGKLGSQCVVEA